MVFIVYFTALFLPSMFFFFFQAWTSTTAECLSVRILTQLCLESLASAPLWILSAAVLRHNVVETVVLPAKPGSRKSKVCACVCAHACVCVPSFSCTKSLTLLVIWTYLENCAFLLGSTDWGTQRRERENEISLHQCVEDPTPLVPPLLLRLFLGHLELCFSASWG